MEFADSPGMDAAASRDGPSHAREVTQVLVGNMAFLLVAAWTIAEIRLAIYDLAPIQETDVYRWWSLAHFALAGVIAAVLLCRALAPSRARLAETIGTLALVFWFPVGTLSSVWMFVNRARRRDPPPPA